MTASKETTHGEGPVTNRHITDVTCTSSIGRRYRPSCSCGWIGGVGTYRDACAATTTHYFAFATLRRTRD